MDFETFWTLELEQNEQREEGDGSALKTEQRNKYEYVRSCPYGPKNGKICFGLVLPTK